MTSPFGRFERTIFTKDILSKLRLEIILGNIPAETRILETQLSSDYGVSRGPVRAALQTLEQEGLVKVLPNGRTVVNGFSRKDAEDLFDFRFMIERRAVELILADPMVSYAPVIEIVEKMRAINQKANEQEDVTRTISILDIQFHHAVVVMSENNILLKGWENISNLLYTVLNIANLSYSSFFKFYQKHKELSDAIIQRNPETPALLETHILGAKELLLTRLAAKLTN